MPDLSDLKEENQVDSLDDQNSIKNTTDANVPDIETIEDVEIFSGNELEAESELVIDEELPTPIEEPEITTSFGRTG